MTSYTQTQIPADEQTATGTKKYAEFDLFAMLCKQNETRFTQTPTHPLFEDKSHFIAWDNSYKAANCNHPHGE